MTLDELRFEEDGASVRPAENVRARPAESSGGPDITDSAGKYRLLRLIGQGGMGAVYEAEHVRLRRRCAVKLLRRDSIPGVKAARRFEREASVLARLVHENIVSVLDIGSTRDGQPFLVLEYIEGCTLRAELDAAGVRGLARVLDIVAQLCRGLAHAHAAGIVHRDLKPENVMLSRHADGRLLVKLLDFGIARPAEGAEVMTKTDAVLGTAAYMSPEQARGERGVRPAADVFALGVIVYEALAGKRPFDGASYNETLYAILNKPHEPLSRWRPELPASVTQAVDRALAKERSQRFANVMDFAQALGLPSAPEAARDAAPAALVTRAGGDGAGAAQPRSAWRRTLLAAALVVALGGATAFRSGLVTAPAAPAAQEASPAPAAEKTKAEEASSRLAGPAASATATAAPAVARVVSVARPPAAEARALSTVAAQTAMPSSTLRSTPPVTLPPARFRDSVPSERKPPPAAVARAEPAPAAPAPASGGEVATPRAPASSRPLEIGFIAESPYLREPATEPAP